MSSKFTVRTRIEVEFEVELEMEKYTPAKLTGHPDTWSPEEGGEVNILSVKIVDSLGSVSEDIADKIGKGLLRELETDAVNEVNENCKSSDSE